MWRVPWSFPHGFCLKVQEDLDWECGVCFWCLPKRITAIDLEVRGMMCVEQKFYFINMVENWKQWDFLEYILVMQNKSSSFWVHQFHFVHLIQPATCLPRRNMHIQKFSQQAPLHSGTGWGSWYLCWQAVRLLSTGGETPSKFVGGWKPVGFFTPRLLIFWPQALRLRSTCVIWCFFPWLLIGWSVNWYLEACNFMTTAKSSLYA